MARYRLTQHQFDTINDLRKQFGDDVRLADLHNNSILIDSRGWIIEDARTLDLPLVQACAHLHDSQIENMLHEKIDNIVFCAHYDLKCRAVGLNMCKYNGVVVHADGADDAKLALENAIPGIDVVAHAIKTCDVNSLRTMDGEFVKNPTYSRPGRFVFGNIVYRNQSTGRFYAMPRWVRIDAPRTGRDASANGMKRFCTMITDGNCANPAMSSSMEFLNAIRQEIQKTL